MTAFGFDLASFDSASGGNAVTIDYFNGSDEIVGTVSVGKVNSFVGFLATASDDARRVVVNDMVAGNDNGGAQAISSSQRPVSFLWPATGLAC